MGTASTVTAESRVPILFLKTKSTPTDAYEDLFNQQPVDRCHFEPQFVPVLRHSFKDGGVAKVDAALRGREISNKVGAAYGGMIFTSQRAVEAFAAIVEKGKGLYFPPQMVLSVVTCEWWLTDVAQATRRGRTYRTCRSTASVPRQAAR